MEEDAGFSEEMELSAEGASGAILERLHQSLYEVRDVKMRSVP